MLSSCTPRSACSGPASAEHHLTQGKEFRVQEILQEDQDNTLLSTKQRGLSSQRSRNPPEDSLSRAGRPRAPSLPRCNGYRRPPAHHVFLQRCAGHPPQTQGDSEGNGHARESLPQPHGPTLPPCEGCPCSAWHRGSCQLSGEPGGTRGKAAAQSEARYWYTSHVLPKSVERSISIAAGSGDCGAGEEHL